MLDLKLVFKPDDFASTLSIFEEEMSEEVLQKNSFLWLNNYFPTAITIAKRIGTNHTVWFEKMGDCYISVSKNETDPSRFWLKAKLYGCAIEAYKKAGNNSKLRQTEQLNFELKPLIKLPTIQIPREEEEIDRLTQLAAFIKYNCNKLLKKNPEEIYESLIGGWFYPTRQQALNATQKEKYFYEQFLTVVEFDRNKNIHHRNTDAHKERRFQEIYNYYIDTVTLQYLFNVFIPGIKSGHLTYTNLLGYLHKHTWLGKPYIKTDLGGNEVPINWITLIAPAIVEYFVQIQSWTSNTSFTPSFVLSIDSLTLKMEGLLRNFSERLNISTTVHGKKGLQEAYVGYVLDNDALRQYFNEDDRQFFKYLFASEGGINLRNNVAHCFYNYFDYNLDKMHLLLAALLKIAQYDLTEPE